MQSEFQPVIRGFILYDFPVHIQRRQPKRHDSPVEAVRDRVRIGWDALDTWMEEEVEVEDVREELLTPTETSTACPYKGIAHYWSVMVDDVTYQNLVWGYRDPLPESAGVEGLACFYNEKVDIEIDGVVVERPTTKFS